MLVCVTCLLLAIGLFMPPAAMYTSVTLYGVFKLLKCIIQYLFSNNVFFPYSAVCN